MYVMYHGSPAAVRQADPFWTEQAPELICRHPVLALAFAMTAMGAGLLLSLWLTVLTVSLPLGLLLGWF